MAISKNEFMLEKQYLADTIRAVENRLIKLGGIIETQIKDVTEMKRHLADDAFDIDDEDLVSTHNKVNDLVDFTNMQMRETHMLKKAAGNPYFGRIDFKINNDPDLLKVYVGLISIEDGGEYYVFDWRAPVAELFYESGLGEASYRSPKSKISGEVTLKRQFNIAGGQLLEAYEIDLNIADEFLQNVLSQHRDTKSLKNIASSIQAEQNQIIRNNFDNVLVVQGYAGSGKTSVALHRVAYSLYREKNLSSSNILIFSPNSAFSSYISGVLPELGEDNTLEATFARFVKRIIKTTATVESQDEFVTRFGALSALGKKVVHSKLCIEAEEEIDKFLASYYERLNFTEDVDIGAKVISAAELNEMLHTTNADSRLYERINNIAENIALQSGIVQPKAIGALRENLISRLSASIKLMDVYNEFNKEVFGCGSLGDRINFEDACLLCTLKSKLQNIVVKMDVRSVVIDEAQDYPLLLLKFLFTIFPRAKFTVLGDANQKTLPGTGNNLKEIEKLKPNETKYVELNRTYRSSEEIVEYTSRIIGEERHNVFRLKNNRPVITRKLSSVDAHLAADIKNSLAQGDRSVGIITANEQRAKEVYKMLKIKLGDKVGLVADDEHASLAQVLVMPVLLAKGMEFEGVIVLRDKELKENKNLFYIACSRAIQALAVYE